MLEKMNQYKKTSGKLSFKRNGKLIKVDSKVNGGIFNAYEYEIPTAFMNTIVLIKDNNIEEPDTESKAKITAKTVKTEEKDGITLDNPTISDEITAKTVKIEEPKPAYRLQDRGRGYFDVVATYQDGTTKSMNEKALRKQPAEDLLESLL